LKPSTTKTNKQKEESGATEAEGKLNCAAHSQPSVSDSTRVGWVENILFKTPLCLY
jgi:hypothetical protein